MMIMMMMVDRVGVRWGGMTVLYNTTRGMCDTNMTNDTQHNECVHLGSDAQ